MTSLSKIINTAKKIRNVRWQIKYILLTNKSKYTNKIQFKVPELFLFSVLDVFTPLHLFNSLTIVTSYYSQHVLHLNVFISSQSGQEIKSDTVKTYMYIYVS